MTRKLLPYGEHAVLVECVDLTETLGLMRALHADREKSDHDQIEEIIPGARTLLIKLRGPITSTLSRELLELPIRPESAAHSDPLMIDVDYTGSDLSEVAGLLQLTEQDVISLHTGQVWTVAFCGFAPGFGYLVGEHDALRVPRRATPRTKIPAGSVALADHWSGIYPREGPGGWQLIGTTEVRLWDLDRKPPALLQPGSRIRFVALP